MVVFHSTVFLISMSSFNIFNDFISAFTNTGGNIFSQVSGKQATVTPNGSPVTNVNNFVSLLGAGLARPNKYFVEFRLPMGFSELASNPGVNSESAASNIRQVENQLNKNDAIGLMCHTLNMPARALEVYSHKQLVSPYKVPKGIQEYEPVTFSLYADSKLNTRHYFDVWQTAVVNTGSNTLNYYNEYTSDVNIYMIDSEGNYSPYFVTLYEAWPMTVGDLAFSYSQNNAFQTVTVTLAYKSWQSAFDDTKRGSF